jgi:hypothetical protein
MEGCDVTGRHTSVIRAGALALAIGGGISMFGSPAEAAALRADCGSGLGPLSFVTGTVCGVLDDVGAALTDGHGSSGKGPDGQGAPGQLAKAAGEHGAQGRALGRSGSTGQDTGDDDAADAGTGAADDTESDTGASAASATGGTGGEGTRARTEAGTTVRETTTGGSVEGTARKATGASTGASGSGGKRGRPGRTPCRAACGKATGDRSKDRPATGAGEGSRGTGLPATRPSAGPTSRERPRRTPPGPGSRSDQDDARLPLLWPGLSLPELRGGFDPRPLAAAHPAAVVAHRASDDVVGTSLTMALLLSAILATRIVSTRRARSGRHDTIPLEAPLGTGQGRQRAA